MFGRMFQSAKKYTKVGWIKSDGQSYIDLATVPGSDFYQESYRSYWKGFGISLYLAVPSTADPGCIFGCKDELGNTTAMRVVPTKKYTYTPVTNQSLSQYGMNLTWSADRDAKFTQIVFNGTTYTADFDWQNDDPTWYWDEYYRVKATFSTGKIYFEHKYYDGSTEREESTTFTASEHMTPVGWTYVDAEMEFQQTSLFKGHDVISGSSSAFPIFNDRQRLLDFRGIYWQAGAGSGEESWACAANMLLDDSVRFEMPETTQAETWQIGHANTNLYLFGLHDEPNRCVTEICKDAKVSRVRIYNRPTYGATIYGGWNTIADYNAVTTVNRDGVTVAGLYDRINHVFRGNAASEGTILWGST